MNDLKVYTNKNIGSFLSIPASKTAKVNNLEDSIYFSRHLNKLRNKSIDQLRDTEHYKRKTRQYATSLEGIDTTSLKDMSTKLKLNVKMYNPLAKTADSQCVQGGAARKSYKTIELLRVSKNSFKPMLFLGGDSKTAAKSFVQYQKYQNQRPPRNYRGSTTTSPKISSLRTKVTPQRQLQSRAAANFPDTNTNTGTNNNATKKIFDSLMKDSKQLFTVLNGDADFTPDNFPLGIFSNPLYKDFQSHWDPRTMIFEEVKEVDEGQGDEQRGGDFKSALLYYGLDYIRNKIDIEKINEWTGLANVTKDGLRRVQFGRKLRRILNTGKWVSKAASSASKAASKAAASASKVASSASKTVFKAYKVSNEWLDDRLEEWGVPNLEKNKDLFLILAGSPTTVVNKDTVRGLDGKIEKISGSKQLWPVGFLWKKRGSKSQEEDVLKITISQKLHMKWYSNILASSESPEGLKKWVEIIGYHVRKDYLLRPDEFKALKDEYEKNEVKPKLDALLKSYEWQKDENLTPYGQMLQDRTMEDDDWKDLQDYTSVPVESVKEFGNWKEKNVKYVKKVGNRIFRLWAILVILSFWIFSRQSFSYPTDAYVSNGTEIAAISPMNMDGNVTIVPYTGSWFPYREKVVKLLNSNPFNLPDYVTSQNAKLIIEQGFTDVLRKNPHLFMDNAINYSWKHIWTYIYNIKDEIDDTEMALYYEDYEEDIQLPFEPLTILRLDNEFQDALRTNILSELRMINLETKILMKGSSSVAWINYFKNNPRDSFDTLNIRYSALLLKRQIFLDQNQRNILKEDMTQANLPDMSQIFRELLKTNTVRKAEFTTELWGTFYETWESFDSFVDSYQSMPELPAPETKPN